MADEEAKVQLKKRKETIREIILEEVPEVHPKNEEVIRANLLRIISIDMSLDKMAVGEGDLANDVNVHLEKVQGLEHDPKRLLQNLTPRWMTIGGQAITRSIPINQHKMRTQEEMTTLI